MEFSNYMSVNTNQIGMVDKKKQSKGIGLTMLYNDFVFTSSNKGDNSHL